MNSPNKSSIKLLSTIVLNSLIMLKITYLSAQVESRQASCLSALLGGPPVSGHRKLSRFIKVAQPFVTENSFTHRGALMELFLKLTEKEVITLITTRDLNAMAFNHNNQQIREIIIDFYVQKNNDVLNMDDESIDRIYELLYNEVTKEEVEDVFRALNLMPNDSNADESSYEDHLNKILEEIRTIKKQRQKRSIFIQQLQNGTVERVHVSKSVIRKFNDLDRERIRNDFIEFIKDMNDKSLNYNYLHRKWKHSNLNPKTYLYHAHIGKGHPTYVICYTMENNIINLFFFGTHEQTGKKFKICKRRA